MFKNYLTVAIRNLLRHKSYSAINIAGLAVGMAFCILIFLYVQNEYTYDTFHQNADRIYRVHNIQKLPGGEKMFSARSPKPLGGALKNDYPELDVVRLMTDEMLVTHAENTFKTELFFADPEIFEVFNFPLLAGDQETALNSPSSAVISQHLARKYFGAENPMGKTLTLDNEHDLTVTGVLKEIPQNSSIKFDMLLLPAGLKLQLDPEMGNQWGWNMFYTYVRTSEAFSARELEDQLPYLCEKHMPGWLRDWSELSLQPLKSIHLDTRMTNEMVPPVSATYLNILSSIALAILLIVCFNFMNLSTARYTERTREIAVRKVLGAGRHQLIRQFLGEAVLLSLLALVCGVALAELLLPMFNGLVGKELALDYQHDLLLLAGLLGFGTAVGVFSGIYPAFFLSACSPLSGLTRNTGKKGGSIALRRSLVVIQFAISIVLIICALVVVGQVRYMKGKDLGFNSGNMLVVRTPVMPDKYLNAIALQGASAGVLSVSQSSSIPGYNFDNMGTRLIPEGWQKDNPLDLYWVAIDERFLETYGMQLVSGRNFSAEFSMDMKQGVLLNEAAVARIGWQSAVGKELRQLLGEKSFKVVGVVRDIHFQSLQNEISPLMYIYSRPNSADNQDKKMFVSVEINSADIPGALRFLEEKWRELAPDHPFEYFFLDDEIYKKYQAEDETVKIIGGFSLLAILLACLGSFGLVALAATRRTKEIGIRKTLGASVMQIVVLLCLESIILLGVAILIACPVAWYFMDRWLQDFAYRIELGPETFVLGGLLALTITLLTVSFQAVKAARANPVDALRYE